MIDAKMKRMMKWHTDGSYIDTDIALQKYWSEVVKNTSTEDLKMLLNAHYGINPEPIDPIVAKIITDELRYRSAAIYMIKEFQRISKTKQGGKEDGR